MPAAKIMLIRHAEKPNGDGGPGLMPNGAENPRALTQTGWKRANALVGLFNPTDGASPKSPLAKPGSLFASGSESLRPKQTIAPVAAAVNLSIRTFLKGQEPQLVAAVKGAEDPVLICWQHEAIPEIGALIRDSADGIPPKWPSIASISFGGSIFRGPGLGASRRFPSSSCRATPRHRSARASSG